MIHRARRSGLFAGGALLPQRDSWPRARSHPLQRAPDGSDTRGSIRSCPPATTTGDDWKQAQPLDAIERGAWWQVFSDPQLDELETRTQQANQGLKAAYARLRARARHAASPEPTTGRRSTGNASLRTRPGHLAELAALTRPGPATEGGDFDLEADCLRSGLGGAECATKSRPPKPTSRPAPQMWRP